jgi:predicted nuclease of restriction endonuclease-like (RecB) superfamily
VNFPTPPTRASVPDWYPELLDAVADCVRTGRQRAVSAANQELVSTYWAMGAEILARQDAEGWGTRVIDRLSADLRERFPGTSGFSPRNLKYMRAFAAAWPDFAIVQAWLAQLPWYHHVALLDKLDDPEMRLWYGQAAIEQGWSRDVLVHHIEGRFHERAGRAVTNFARVLPPPDSDLAQQSTRDPYLFDFVGNADIRRERDLERALIDHVERFLLELGQGFAFVGKQLHLEIGDADFYTDLLFYHLKLPDTSRPPCQVGHRRASGRSDERAVAIGGLMPSPGTARSSPNSGTPRPRSLFTMNTTAPIASHTIPPILASASALYST